jgi:4a-hydroxytetrahydrobiopterin dehydratase
MVNTLRLHANQVSANLRKVPGWKLQGKRISKTFIFEDFMQVISFVNQLAKTAEAMNHHPDMSIKYNKIRLSLTTHDEGGLTRKDFRLATKINSMTLP